MALFKPFLLYRKISAIPGLNISQFKISTIVAPRVSVSVSFLPSNHSPSPQSSCSGSSTSSFSSSSTESDTCASIGVFIKGLPESTAEGRLKKAFSKFGEVVRVKLVVEKSSKQPLGSAFVWYANKESALLAVKEMNGEFFDGRFILVKIAEPGLSKSKGRVTPYKF